MTYIIKNHLSKMVEHPLLYGIYNYDLLVSMVNSLTDDEILHLSHKVSAMDKEIKDFSFIAMLSIVISLVVTNQYQLGAGLFAVSCGIVIAKALQKIGEKCRKRILEACSEVLEKR